MNKKRRKPVRSPRTKEQIAATVEKRKQTIANWSDERREAYRKRQSEIFSDLFKGENNPFYGKKHSEETKAKLRKRDVAYTKTAEFSEKVKAGMVGIDTAVSLKKVWTEKYGENEAELRLAAWRDKLSQAMSGDKNPMFGKPAPFHAGNGIQGWYNQHYFRSLRELSLMLQFDSQQLEWKTGECQSLRAQYINWDGKIRTTTPDFIVNNSRVIECKPLHLQASPNVKLKIAAMQAKCAELGYEFELIDPELISLEELNELIASGKVLLTQRTQEKLQLSKKT